MHSCVTRSAATTAILFALTGTALAHAGAGATSGFMQGFMHPAGGPDHVLAMLAVGLYAAQLGGRALWLVPATFVGVMAAGGALGATGFALPHVEIGIALSVVVFGLAIVLHASVPTLAAMALVGGFALLHGHAHGAEMPQDATGYACVAGFMLATALLHGAGIAAGTLTGRAGAGGARRSIQLGGSAVALAGVLILIRMA